MLQLRSKESREPFFEPARPHSRFGKAVWENAGSTACPISCPGTLTTALRAHQHKTAKTAEPAAGRRPCGPHSAATNGKHWFALFLKVCRCSPSLLFMLYNFQKDVFLSHSSVIFTQAKHVFFPPPIVLEMEEKQVWTRRRIQHDASANLSICINSFPWAVSHISLYAIFSSLACCYF